MNLRSLGYVVETVEVSDVDDLINAIKVARRKPVELIVPRNLFTMLEPHLKKSRYVYLVTSASDKNVVVSVAAPEALLFLDYEFHSKSYKLANPMSLYSVLSASDVEATGVVASQLDLLRLLLSKRHGIRLHAFVSDEYYGRAYLLTSGSKVCCTVYMDALVYYGNEALRLLFYRLPYRYVLYKVEIT